jgi:hypothetical protein
MALRKARLPGKTILLLSVMTARLALPADDPPAPAEQQKMLDQTRQYAAQYVAGLPNFICLRVVHQFEAGRKPQHWHKGDSLASRLVFSEGKEKRTLELVNGKPPERSRFVRRPLTTEGEFGGQLSNMFAQSTDASFSWRGWETIRGKRLAVFEYTVDKQHSAISLSLGDLAHATVAYQGSVYTDPATGAVWRITNHPIDIPPEVRTKSLFTLIDYDTVDIAGKSYLLPVQASVQMDTGSNNVLNQIEFQGYRKFEADSRITFAGPDSN